jgi:hypothetical protein
MCEACYEPQWSDALHDWEFVEEMSGPCGACRVLQMEVARILDGTDLGAPLADRANESADRGGGMLGAGAGYDALLDAVAPGAGAREGF